MIDRSLFNIHFDEYCKVERHFEGKLSATSYPFSLANDS